MLDRLQKIISQAGIASRRDAEKIISEGRVAVNGKIVSVLGAKADPDTDHITVDGKKLSGQEHVYILLNKPKGVVTTTSDPQQRKTVIDLITTIKQRIYPVGRLDYNTEGLLLLTNDGELTNAMIHPSRKVPKTYIAKVNGIANEEKLDKLRAGIRLSDGVTAPAIINLLALDKEAQTTTIEITIHEGKNRQVRRMFEAVGYDVKQLKRTKFAFLTLTGLKRGQYRHLSTDEIIRLKQYYQDING